MRLKKLYQPFMIVDFVSGIFYMSVLSVFFVSFMLSVLSPWKMKYVMLSIETNCGAFVLYLYGEKYTRCRLEVIYPFVLHKYYPLVDALLGFGTEM